jgi:hypothetical protein
MARVAWSKAAGATIRRPARASLTSERRVERKSVPRCRSEWPPFDSLMKETPGGLLGPFVPAAERRRDRADREPARNFV